ncbi:hypothetical protein GMOD_00000030 [Pyrenophora seminiperda CCB06]|uniref:Uncharacterized protein n=1 Tax=Pyrenophora seminiperda CCB06 TaxID=1302712 RepID=A0A3M7M6G7_9PLEO|nr:hypothetical protein GMOD_00000030 [Pyrenophora seminiperda CCB06]
MEFFPRHIEIPEMQERFSRNEISSTFQANFINYQRNLTIPHIFTPQQVRNMMKKAFKTYPPINPLVSCSTYTVQHYKLTLPYGVPEKYEGEDIKIPYMLFNCADGVDGSKYPEGRDAGPFTKGLRHALIHDHDLKLQDFDKYIEILGISRDLDELYSDRDFMERFLFPVWNYTRMLEAEAEKMGYSWDA